MVEKEPNIPSCMLVQAFHLLGRGNTCSVDLLLISQRLLAPGRNVCNIRVQEAHLHTHPTLTKTIIRPKGTYKKCTLKKYTLKKKSFKILYTSVTAYGKNAVKPVKAATCLTWPPV